MLNSTIYNLLAVSENVEFALLTFQKIIPACQKIYFFKCRGALTWGLCGYTEEYRILNAQPTIAFIENRKKFISVSDSCI